MSVSLAVDTLIKRYGDFYKPRKARFIPSFCKRINRTSTAVGRWVTAFEEGRRTTFSVTNLYTTTTIINRVLHQMEQTTNM